MTTTKEPERSQLQKWYWDASSNRSNPTFPEKPTQGQIRSMLSQNNERCPLNRVLLSETNEGNMRRIKDELYGPMCRYNHSLSGFRLGLFAQSGQGKSFIASCMAKVLNQRPDGVESEFPYVVIRGDGVKTPYDLFMECKKECERLGMPLVQKHGGKFDWQLPPLLIFWDEAHAMNKKLAESDLLPAIDDPYMMTISPPRSEMTAVVDMKDVGWIFATTEKYDLFHALLTRTRPHIEWQSADSELVAKIVDQKVKEAVKDGTVSFGMPFEACQMVAEYFLIPREARDFALSVIKRKSIIPSLEWDEAVKMVADDEGVLKGGFTEKQVAILTQLGQRPTAMSRLHIAARCRPKQVEMMELPPLLASHNGGPYVVPLSRGCAITMTGLALLDSLGIEHNGERVSAESLEKK